MNTIFLMYVPPFLLYFAFAIVVAAGCWKNNFEAILLGVFMFIYYDAKPEMEIIARTKVYQNCTFKVEGEQK